MLRAMTDAAQSQIEAQRLRLQIDYWKQVVQVQMHFNDMCIRTRWLGLTVMATLFAGAAIARDGSIDVIGIEIPFTSLLFAITAIVAAALWQLDERYYFRMLTAAVEQGELIEPEIQRLAAPLIPDLCLTQQISASISRGTARFIARWFYGVPFIISLLLFLVTAFWNPDATR
jgi:hypothetical protein